MTQEATRQGASGDEAASAPSQPRVERDAAVMQGVLPGELAALASIEEVDARRIWALALREGALPGRAQPGFRRAALERVREVARFGEIGLAERRASQLDPFVKYAFRLGDGAIVETVRIPLEREGRFSVCVSSQVGCALACAFCATGRMGLARNLDVWEIVEQVRRVAAELGRRDGSGPAAEVRGNAAPALGKVHGVLFQGMGEPLANADRVIRAVKILSEPSGLAIDMRNITVCTAGIPTGIRRIAREIPGVRLGLSLGSLRPNARAELMPIDRAHPLDDVLDAVAEHTRATGHAPMWAYTLLADVNDAPEDGARLAALAARFQSCTGVRPRLSLIPYNSIALAPFARSGRDRLDAFRDAVHAGGFGTIVRYSGGGDVSAACGQLATLRGTLSAAADPGAL